MHPPDHTNAVDTRGPITQIHNGRGVRPRLPELVCAPGYAYLVAEAMVALWERSRSPDAAEQRHAWRRTRLAVLQQISRREVDA